MRLPHARIEILFASACLILIGGPNQMASAQEADPISVGNDIVEQLRTELNEKLNQTVEVKFEETPLRQAVAEIADQIQVDVLFADRAIEEEGLTTDGPVTCVLEHTKLPARAALELLLEPAGLTAINRDGIVWITTEERAEDIFYIRVYDVRDLVENFSKTLEPYHDSLYESPGIHDDVEENCAEKTSKNNSATTGHFSGEEYGGTMEPQFFDLSPTDCLQWYGGPRGLAIAAVFSAIHSEATGPWQNWVGTGGQAKLFNGQLIVTQTAENHVQIQKILDELRSNKETRGRVKQAAKEKEKSRRPVVSPLPTY